MISRISINMIKSEAKNRWHNSLPNENLLPVSFVWITEVDWSTLVSMDESVVIFVGVVGESKFCTVIDIRTLLKRSNSNIVIESYIYAFTSHL